MKLTFEYLGATRTLNKHPKVQLALRRGEITETDAKAQPWYLRAKLDGKERTFKLAVKDKDAERGARDILKGHVEEPKAFSKWLDQRQAARSVTLGSIAQDWAAAGYATADGHPRPAKAADNLKRFADSALKWWAGVPAQTTTKAKLLEFATWRRGHSARGTGDRSADLELAALSSMCQWALATERIKANPFAKRPRFRRSETVRHCHQQMPGSDEELHRILTWLWSQELTSHKIAGAWLAFCALTGLRPGEPSFLKRHKRMTEPPQDPRSLAPGTVFQARDGRTMIKVQRLKNGQNPYIHLHPAALDFLDRWEDWLNNAGAGLKAATYWFPHMDDGDRPIFSGDNTTELNKHLAKACEGCEAPRYKPHGFGRAYYVRVRRSQGADDNAIACELGQTTNGKLIRSTYGDPGDMLGGAQFDWLPADPKATAWAGLMAAPAPDNIIAIA